MYGRNQSSYTVKGSLSTITMLIACLFASTGFAQESYEHGHGAMQIFDEAGMANTPKWVIVWIWFLLFAFVSGIVFVKNHIEARWIVGGFIATMVVGAAISSIFGIPRLSGFLALMHLICWSPGLIIMLTRRPFFGPISAYSIWCGLITSVIIFSFIFDIRDAAIFLTSYPF